MAECGESKEAALFRKYSSDFKRAMIHPVEVADDLYSSRIIDEITHRKIKRHQNASDLVDAIESFVSSQTQRGIKLVKKFEKVLNILKKYIPLDSIIKSLENEYYGMLCPLFARIYFSIVASDDDDDDDDDDGSKKAIEEAVPSELMYAYICGVYI